MKNNVINRTNESDITLNGMMTFGECENGLRYADFECCEHIWGQM